MTHDGYKEAKQDYFKDEVIDKLRERTLGTYTYPVKIGKEKITTKIRALARSNQQIDLMNCLMAINGFTMTKS